MLFWSMLFNKMLLKPDVEVVFVVVVSHVCDDDLVDLGIDMVVQVVVEVMLELLFLSVFCCPMML